MNRIGYLESGAGLAPMAGCADSSFREICREMGAAWCVSEMISAKALLLGDVKTPKLAYHTEAERPFGLQLFGSEPETVAQAAAVCAERFLPDFIDLNMGCPAPKITGSGAGSALMRDPERAEAMARLTAEAVSLPVTVKIRAGWERNTAPDLALRLEQAGAAAITVHGRTRSAMYAPPVDYTVIRAVREAVSVPVIANGDIASADSALRMRKKTGCTAIMIGRGALGNPFIFREVCAALQGLPIPQPPHTIERLSVLRRQVRAMCELKGDYIGMLEARKHAAWYTKGFRGAAKLREFSSAMKTPEDLDSYISMVLEASSEGASSSSSVIS